MRDVFVTESAFGKHHTELPFSAKIVSLQGSNGVTLNVSARKYQVSKNLVSGLKDLNARYIFMGTDLDVQGTKVATLIKNALNGGTKVYRYALTEKGYIRLGEFFDQSRMEHLLREELDNIDTARRMQSKFGRRVGKKTAMVIGAVGHIKESGQRNVKVKSKGTSTITAITKGLLKGVSASAIGKRLKNLYMVGQIAYPRVDNDYIQEAPYDLYPHPELTSLGYSDEYISPIEEDELPLSKRTVLLELSNRRLITPSMAERYYQVIDSYFEDDLSPRKQEIDLIRECMEIYRQEGEEYVKGLAGEYTPQLLFSPPVPPPPPPGASKKEEEEWEEMVSKLLEKEREEREKEEKKRKERGLRQASRAFSN